MRAAPLSATVSPSRSASFLCWPIASPVRAASTRWHPGWRVLRLYRARPSLATAVETLAPGESELRAVEAVVSNPGRSAGAESPPGKRALLGVATPVQPATRLGVLRPHLHLF